MEVKFEKKFSEQQLDQFIHDVYNNYKLNPSDTYQFNLTETEWISNQGLLLLTGLLKYFIVKHIHFEVLFIKKGTPINNVPKRVALQIVQIWETWGIWKIIPSSAYREYLGIDDSTIKALKMQYNIHFIRPEIYDAYEITPFVCLDNIQNYDDSIIIDTLNKYHALNNATIQIVKENDCAHPFVNELFGEIISREIFENFLNHYESTFFSSPKDFAFFSLVLKGKIDEDYHNIEEIQTKLNLNFTTEELPQSKDFFANPKTNEFKNQSYICYSFFDFGIGIVNSLRDEFVKKRKLPKNNPDAEIIKFAFRHDSSRNPIRNVFNNVELKEYIPRGLFDVLSLVQRYNGLLIIRSCYGKVLYNFSRTTDIEKAFSTFGNKNLFFPGTFITLYLPAINNGIKIDESVIKPVIQIPKYVKSQARYVSLYKLIEKANQENEKDIYSILFTELYDIFKKNINTLTYFSLENITDKQLIKKTIFFLIANYEININNNVVIFHPPKKELLDEINHEIVSLSRVNKNYKIHPLPFIYFEPTTNVIALYWLGIYDNQDKKTLDNLLYNQFSIAKSDFNNPDSIIGHLNYFDSYNNLESIFPNENEIIEFYKKGELFSRISEIDTLVKNKCISRNSDSIFLCNGNYYQKEYLELINLLNDQKICRFLSTTLFNILLNYFDNNKFDNKKYKFIAFTSSSHRILNSLKEEGFVATQDLILIDNYHDIEKLGKKLPVNLVDYNYIIFCDAISTGYLVTRIDSLLVKDQLKYIAVIADTIDPNFASSKEFYENYEKKIVSLVKYPIQKFLRDSPEIAKYLNSEKVLRINPYTNIPIKLSNNETNPDKTILTKDEFLEILNEKDINIGFLKFNSIIHPYYFDTKKIIKEVGILLFEKIFNKKNTLGQNMFTIDTKNLRIFYPKDSDIQYLDFKRFKHDVLKDHSAAQYELERFNTEDGWKFPHTTEHIGEIVNGNPVLILDDGTCTGDSLTQMINEISFYNPNKITVLSLIGRLLVHRREFLSTINRIKKNKKILEVEIFFGSHWHIPTYLIDDNPNTIERKRLSELIRISNTPSRIKKFSYSIYRSLQPKQKDVFTNHKYLPKIKGTSLAPFKEMIKTRDEVGKVVGYRFYKENFNWFNSFIRKYESSERIDRYKEIELLSATISYEPYLYTRLRKILPDITDKLCEFIDSIIFGNPKRRNKQLNVNDLYYEWDNKDLIHLLFIINPNDELIDKLKEKDNTSRLLQFFERNEIPIDYLFYKFLMFFPLNSFEIKEKNPSKILALLKTFPQNDKMKEDYLRQLNIFKAYISSLPSKKEFNHQLIEISDTLENLLKDKFHKTSLRAQLGYILSDVETMNVNFDAVDFRLFQNNWINISKFLALILSFVNSYPSYLPRKIFIEAESISLIYGRLNELIPNLRKNSSFIELDTNLEAIRRSIFNSNSEIFKLFLNPMTYNILSNIESKIKEFNMVEICNIQSTIHKDSKLVFPEYYFKEIVLDTILNNLRHRDITNDPVIIYVHDSLDKGYVEIKIENSICSDYKPGTGYGSVILDYANGFPQDGFKYNAHKSDNIYIQHLQIKKF